MSGSAAATCRSRVQTYPDGRLAYWTGGKPGQGAREWERHGTQQLADARAEELRAAFAHGPVFVGPKGTRTLKDLAQHILDVMRATHHPGGTVAAYKSDWNTHIADEIGSIRWALWHYTAVFNQLAQAGASEAVVSNVPRALGALRKFGFRRGYFVDEKAFGAEQRLDLVADHRRLARIARADEDGRITLDICPTVDDVADYAAAIEAEYPGYGARSTGSSTATAPGRRCSWPPPLYAPCAPGFDARPRPLCTRKPTRRWGHRPEPAPTLRLGGRAAEPGSRVTRPGYAPAIRRSSSTASTTSSGWAMWMLWNRSSNTRCELARERAASSRCIPTHVSPPQAWLLRTASGRSPNCGWTTPAVRRCASRAQGSTERSSGPAAPPGPMSRSTASIRARQRPGLSCVSKARCSGVEREGAQRQEQSHHAEGSQRLQQGGHGARHREADLDTAVLGDRLGRCVYLDEAGQALGMLVGVQPRNQPAEGVPDEDV